MKKSSKNHKNLNKKPKSKKIKGGTETEQPMRL